MDPVADPILDKMPHVKARWVLQAGHLLAFGDCPCCGVGFGLSGTAEYLASGEAKHWCRLCHNFLRVTAVGSQPDVPPLPWAVSEETTAE